MGNHHSPDHQEFSDVFLVAVFDPTIPMSNTVRYGQTNAQSHGESLFLAMKIWERNLICNTCRKDRWSIERRVLGVFDLGELVW